MSQRHAIWVSLLVVAAGLTFVASAAAAKPGIPIHAESAFCNGQPVEPVSGVLQLDSSCVLNLQIIWVSGMKEAYVEVSSDGGATWQKEPQPLLFTVTGAGLIAGVGFPACDATLPSGTYLFRVHGFRSPNENGDVFSDPFPDSVSLNCT